MTMSRQVTAVTVAVEAINDSAAMIAAARRVAMHVEVPAATGRAARVVLADAPALTGATAVLPARSTIVPRFLLASR